MRLYFGISLIISVLFSSCITQPEITSADFINFGSEGMVKDQQYLITVTPVDSLMSDIPVDVILLVRYTSSFSYSVLPLLIEEENIAEDNPLSERKIDIRLFDDKKQSSIHGSHNIFEAYDTLSRSLRLENVRKFYISTPLSHSVGIKSIGILTRQANIDK